MHSEPSQTHIDESNIHINSCEWEPSLTTWRAGQSLTVFNNKLLQALDDLQISPQAIFYSSWWHATIYAYNEAVKRLYNNIYIYTHVRATFVYRFSNYFELLDPHKFNMHTPGVELVNIDSRVQIKLSQRSWRIGIF